MSVERKHLCDRPSEFLPVYDVESDSFSDSVILKSGFCDDFEDPEDYCTEDYYSSNLFDESFDDWLLSMTDL